MIPRQLPGLARLVGTRLMGGGQQWAGGRCLLWTKSADLAIASEGASPFAPPPPPPQQTTGSKPSSSSSQQRDATKKPWVQRGEFNRNGPGLMKRILHIRRVARVNSGGKVRSVAALVVVGDGNGSAGYGEGRATDVSGAVAKATKVAEKNMTYFHRFNKRTIFSDVDFRWHSVHLKMRSAPPGYGVIASNHIHEICRCIGISDLGANLVGSRNPMNVIKATFEALKQQREPEDIALARGKKVVDVEMTYFGHSKAGRGV